MFQRFLELYEEKMVEWFGYNNVVHGEEIILILGGIVIGIIIKSLIDAYFIKGLYKVENFGQSAFKMIRTREGGKNVYQVSFNNFWEAFQQTLLLTFSLFFTVKNYTKRDERRTRIFLIAMSIASVILIAFMILSICTVFKSTF